MKTDIWIKLQAKKRYNKWEAGPVSCFKTKPSTSEREIAVKFTIEIPDEVFEEPVYEAKISLPKVTRRLPETTEIAKKLSENLSQQMGFKVNVSMEGPENENKT